MNRQTKILAFATLGGLVFFYLVKVSWAYIPDFSPVTKTLFACCTANPWFRPAIYIHDVLVNILLCFPLAIALIKLQPKQLWLAVAFAVIPSFIFGSYHLFLPEYSGLNLTSFAFGWSMELLSLPAAALLVILLANRVSN